MSSFRLSRRYFCATSRSVRCACRCEMRPFISRASSSCGRWSHRTGTEAEDRFVLTGFNATPDKTGILDRNSPRYRALKYREPPRSGVIIASPAFPWQGFCPQSCQRAVPDKFFRNTRTAPIRAFLRVLFVRPSRRTNEMLAGRHEEQLIISLSGRRFGSMRDIRRSPCKQPT
jgi:hypothetical protein